MNLVPTHKSDLATAQAAIDAGYPAIAPILADLTEWLQDSNWPVAKKLAPFLAGIGKPMIEHIDCVFSTNDHIWKYWMIVCLIEESDELLEHYKIDLIRIATNPTQIEKHEELDEVARDALATHNIHLC